MKLLAKLLLLICITASFFIIEQQPVEAAAAFCPYENSCWCSCYAYANISRNNAYGTYQNELQYVCAEIMSYNERDNCIREAERTYNNALSEADSQENYCIAFNCWY